MTTIVSLCIHRRWPASTFQWGIVNGLCYETVQTSHWLARGAPRQCHCSLSLLLENNSPGRTPRRAACSGSRSQPLQGDPQAMNCGCGTEPPGILLCLSKNSRSIQYVYSLEWGWGIHPLINPELKEMCAELKEISWCCCVVNFVPVHV